MAPKFKIGDKFEQGIVQAVRNTDWYDKTTTYSYMIRPSRFGAGYFSAIPPVLWLDEKELKPIIPPCKFKVGDFVVKAGSCQTVLRTYIKNDRWYVDATLCNGYRETELKAWVAPAKFRVGDVVVYDDLDKSVVRINRVDPDGGFGYAYGADGYGHALSERNLTRYVGPRTPTYIGVATGPITKPDRWVSNLSPIVPAPPKKKGCEHFRETEFVVIASKRTIVKNKFCPDCGKRIR